MDAFNAEQSSTGSMSTPGIIESVNVGKPRTVDRRGKPVLTAIWKAPVEGRIRVEGINLVGDDQADRSVHGGVDKSVYAYAAEDYEWWGERLGFVPGPGTFGDNLTVRGLDVSHAVVGERWLVGTVLLEVTQPRMPCFKLGIRMDNPRFPKIFTAAGRHGAYFRIIQSGELEAGDKAEVLHRPNHGLTVADVAHIYLKDHSGVERLLEVPELAASWKEWAQEVSRKRAS